MGLGYIGLPTAGLIASKGIEVLGVDINPMVVDTINRGEVHIVEPALEGLIASVVRKGLLKAVSSPTPADIFMITVPTPIKENKEPEMAFVDAAVGAITPCLESGSLVIIESTSPVGTTERCLELIYASRPELKGAVHIAYCPERVLPGNIIYELEHNDRVIGVIDDASARKASEFYLSLIKGEIHITSVRAAEMCKLVENAYRDVNIAFANELSSISDVVGVDVWELIGLANRHPRVNILQPGPGVGGHCIAIDPMFIVHSAPRESVLIRTAREINEARPEHVVSRVRKMAGGIANPVVACLGLAYKADIDDMRESPAVEIVASLSKLDGWRLLVAEPHLNQLPPELAKSPSVELTDAADAIEKADVVLLLVNHNAFAAVDRQSLAGKIVCDTRGIWGIKTGEPAAVSWTGSAITYK